MQAVRPTIRKIALLIRRRFTTGLFEAASQAVAEFGPTPHSGQAAWSAWRRS